MRRPRRAGLGVLSPRRAPNLGKIRRRACLRLIPLPGTGDVLLAPTMISHPLAYVAPTTRHSALEWYGNPVLEVMLLDHGEPTNYEEAMMSPDSDKWLEAMKYEI